MMKFFLAVGLLLAGFTTTAQTYTRADSLLGYLYPARSCYDVTYYGLDIQIDPDIKSLGGTVKIGFRVVEETDSIQIDLASGMGIESITLDGELLDFRREQRAVYVQFPERLQINEELTIVVEYGGKPRVALNAPWDGGVVWGKDAQGDHLAGVAVEGDGASLWFPCKDHLSDEPLHADIHIAAPHGLMAVSNGRLMGKEVLTPKWTKWKWRVTNPINNYNITFYVGNFTHISDFHINATTKDTLTLDYYVNPDNRDKALEHFKQVHDMLDCFEFYFGPYPFYSDGYKLVESPYLGMEHQSAIAYGNQYNKGYLGMDASGLGFDYIIVHETAHEWFGNSISAGDAAEIWIHESFATYAEAIYVEHFSDYQTAIRYMLTQKRNIKNAKPIIGPLGVNDPEWNEDTDLYYKGAWMLQTIRAAVNDKNAWFSMIREMPDRFSHQVVTTDDVLSFMTSRLGLDLTTVFDQYLRHTDLPVLQYKLSKKGQDVVLKYRWKADVEGFTMPAEVVVGMTGKQRLLPTTEWQTTRLVEVGTMPVKFNTREYLIDTEEL